MGTIKYSALLSGQLIRDTIQQFRCPGALRYIRAAQQVRYPLWGAPLVPPARAFGQEEEGEEDFFCLLSLINEF